MSVENMTEASLLLFEAAGIFAAAASVMFLLFDIPKCCKMVSGKFPARDWKKAPNRGRQEKRRMESLRTEKLAGGEETVMLGMGTEETVMLGTNELEIVQDISSRGGKGYE